jgi:hypothetical protein
MQRGEEEVYLQRGAVWQLELGSVWGDSEVGDFGALVVEFLGDLGARSGAWRLRTPLSCGLHPSVKRKKRKGEGVQIGWLCWVGRAGPVSCQSSFFIRITSFYFLFQSKPFNLIQSCYN